MVYITAWCSESGLDERKWMGGSLLHVLWVAIGIVHVLYLQQ